MSKLVRINAMLAAIGMLLLTTAANAQFGAAPNYATVSASVSPKKVAAGHTALLTVVVAVSPGFHINAVKPNDPDLIPTVLTLDETAGIKFGEVRYPHTQTLNEPELSTAPLLVYTGAAKIIVPVIPKASGRYHVTGSVSYQGCNSTSCYPPSQHSFVADLVAQ